MIRQHQNYMPLALLSVLLLLNACTYGRIDVGSDKYSQASAIKSQGGTYKVGTPYKVLGNWYYPKEDYDYSEVGIASWYGEDFHSLKTANGENYDMNTLTAAHRTLPLPSIVKVTNLENGRSLVLRINDRGPYAKNRIIDVSKRAAQLLGFQAKGTAKVRVEIMEKESKELKAALLGEEFNSDYTPIPKTAYNSEASRDPMQLVGSEGSIKSYPKGSWFVQAGAYSRQSSAQNVSKKLESIGDTNIYYVDVNGQKYYRVRIGPFAKQADAAASLERVKNFGIYDAKIVQD